MGGSLSSKATRYHSVITGHDWLSVQTNQPVTGTEEPKPEQPIQAQQSIGGTLQHS